MLLSADDQELVNRALDRLFFLFEYKCEDKDLQAFEALDDLLLLPDGSLDRMPQQDST
jgi:hypothetical protein